MCVCCMCYMCWYVCVLYVCVCAHYCFRCLVQTSRNIRCLKSKCNNQLDFSEVSLCRSNNPMSISQMDNCSPQKKKTCLKLETGIFDLPAQIKMLHGKTGIMGDLSSKFYSILRPGSSPLGFCECYRLL